MRAWPMTTTRHMERIAATQGHMINGAAGTKTNPRFAHHGPHSVARRFSSIDCIDASIYRR